MSTNTFDFLAERLENSIKHQHSTTILRENSIKHQHTILRECVPPKEIIAVTIRYLATGPTFTDLHYTFTRRLGISTISKIVSLVCNALWNLLKDEFLPLPTEENWQKIAEGFKQNAHFPNCLGAVDGKHIRVNRFPHSGSMNLNYKTNYFKLMMEHQLQVPPPCPLHSTSRENFPFVLVADEAFGLAARRYVECAFGILSNKWRILHRPLNVSKKLARDIVKACVILHNVVRLKDAQRPEMYVTQRLQNLPRATSSGNRSQNFAKRGDWAKQNSFPTGLGAISQKGRLGEAKQLPNRLRGDHINEEDDDQTYCYVLGV
ncbi:DDE superfamily endonuclease [Popillia japonica]|uniref:DDE superfamily endonuclease n=1 Tax=Popillia japonica TaxID=7064 RepID=A0AAW1IFT3_POPJA